MEKRITEVPNIPIVKLSLKVDIDQETGERNSTITIRTHATIAELSDLLQLSTQGVPINVTIATNQLAMLSR